MSTPLLEPNVAPPPISGQSRHSSSNSIDFTDRRENGNVNGSGDPRQTISASTSPEPSDSWLPGKMNGLLNGNILNRRRNSVNKTVEPPESPVNGLTLHDGQQTATLPGFEPSSRSSIHFDNCPGEPEHSNIVNGSPNADSTSDSSRSGESSSRSNENRPPPSPQPSDSISSTPTITMNGPAAPSTSSYPASTNEAGPSTSPAVKPGFSARKSSTLRFVPLRVPSASTMPKTSSPLRPPGAHSRTHSTTSSLSASVSAASSPSRAPLRYFDNQLASGSQTPPIIDNTLRSASASPTPTPVPPPTQPFLSPKPVVPAHARSSSLMALPGHPHSHTQRTFSSMSQPPLTAPTSLPSPSPPPAAASSSALSPRMRSPVHTTTPTTPTASSSRAIYRPGFQPKGVYRPLTDDFLEIRRQKREVGRVERTRLERRLEKLIELHFPCEDGKEKGDAGAKGKEKQAPPAVARRSSSFFDIDFNELRSKSATDIWRGVLESRAAAANGGKGDIRGKFEYRICFKLALSCDWL